VLSSAALVVAAAWAYAHHICTPLTATFGGAHIVDEVPFFTHNSSFGVPAYIEATTDIDDGVTVTLHDGDSFSVTSETSQPQTITFTSADFHDISNATPLEIVHAINSQTTLMRTSFQDFMVVRGVTGGTNATLQLQDGQGSPLSQIFLPNAITAFGSNNLEIAVSIPGIACGNPTEGALVGFPYIIFASQTPGSFPYLNQTMPIGYDSTTTLFLNLAQTTSLLPGFTGHLNSTEDSHAELQGHILRDYYGQDFPSKLYLAYAVLRPDMQHVEFVSNVLTIDFQ
jgi:hypothetical protein